MDVAKNSNHIPFPFELRFPLPTRIILEILVEEISGRNISCQLAPIANSRNNFLCDRNVQRTIHGIIPIQVHLKFNCNSFIESMQPLKISIPPRILKNLQYIRMASDLHCLFRFTLNNFPIHFENLSIEALRVETKMLRRTLVGKVAMTWIMIARDAVKGKSGLILWRNPWWIMVNNGNYYNVLEITIIQFNHT